MKVRIRLVGFKKALGLSLMIILVLLLTACDQRSTTYVAGEDYQAPPVPSGVTTTTGDGIIWVEWNPINGIPDLAGFYVWRSIDNLDFFWLATVGENVAEYEDDEVTNGDTYYYGVSSFDDDGNESRVSFDWEDAFDTPRPEGFDEIIYDSNDLDYEDQAGFDFSREERVHWLSSRSDIFLEYDTDLGTFFIWLGDNGRYIQDMGYTDHFDDITYAPDDGWSSLDYVEVIDGHTYVLHTWDNYYAKIRVTQAIFSFHPRMIFDWGYQIDRGNRELKIDPRPRIANAETAEASQ
ncbi:MAG: hypothetical protein V3S06_05050 [candidate division Zixibacteria bacterium]